jgi:uncharacterized protein (DUF58 family)
MNRAAFCAVLVFLSGVFIFTPFYPVQAATLFLLFIVAGCRIYTVYLIRHLTVRRPDRELREFRHNWASVELVVENHGLLPAVMLSVTDRAGNLPVYRGNSTLVTLHGHSRIILRWHVFCSERGLYTLGPVTVRSGDPLGLFPFDIDLHEKTMLYVYPAAARASLPTVKASPLGNLLTQDQRYEDMTRRRSLRPYDAGDEMRRINWKASARAGSLLVNEYEASFSYTMTAFLNLNPADYTQRKKENSMERCIEAAAAACLRASEQNQKVGIIVFAPPNPPHILDPATGSIVPILELLAMQPRRTALPSPVPDTIAAIIEQSRRLASGSRFVYVGPDLGQNGYAALSRLAEQRLFLEYLILDEHSIAGSAAGRGKLYQIQEDGYEIL